MSEKWPKQGGIERYVRSVFLVNFPMQYNELFSVPCQRVYRDKQRLLIEHSAIRPEGYLYSAMQESRCLKLVL